MSSAREAAVSLPPDDEPDEVIDMSEALPDGAEVETATGTTAAAAPSAADLRSELLAIRALLLT